MWVIVFPGRQRRGDIPKKKVMTVFERKSDLRLKSIMKGLCTSWFLTVPKNMVVGIFVSVL